ncbi:hypothetical protein LXL04_004859 [Taraxacum kok-saghyz]
MASGLQLNLHKSRLIGIGVKYDQVVQMATTIGCDSEVLPFKYLRLPVGANMGRMAAWDMLLDRFHTRLSKWKMKMLSIGGRLTLLKYVLGSLGTYYFSLFKMPGIVHQRMETLRAKFFWGIDENERKIHWTKWDLVLNGLDNGGLAVGSLHAFNQALLYKWRWRFLSEDSGLWKRVIISCHGVNGGFSLPSRLGSGGVWGGVVAVVDRLHSTGIVPLNVIRRQVRNGEDTSFWHHVWCGENTLASVFPRLYRLAVNGQAMVADYRGEDGWCFNWCVPVRGGVMLEQLEHLGLLLANFHREVRIHIDSVSLPSYGVPVRWIKYLPKKVNTFLWRVQQDRISTRWALATRGIALDSILCLVCDSAPERVVHLFCSCPTASALWDKLGRWCQMSLPVFVDVEDMWSWIDNLPRTRVHKPLLEVLFGCLLWVIWTYRNAVVFGDVRSATSTGKREEKYILAPPRLQNISFTQANTQAKQELDKSESQLSSLKL